MKYFLVAGEASGDLHAGRLMQAIGKQDPQADFACWGGEKMQDAGGKLLQHYSQLAFMGFWEVLKNLRSIFRGIRQCKSDILIFQPDTLILIDYPGFNLRLAKWAHKKGLRVVWYIAPQLWAWHQSRVKNIKRDVDLLLVILPFEVDFYKKFDIDAQFVGHPLLDDPAFDTKNAVEERNIITLLPGSRKQEISRHLPLMSALVKRMPQEEFVVAGMSHLGENYYKKVLNSTKVHIVFDASRELLQKSKAAVVASGTATLEAALLNVPQVVCYKSNAISYFIGKQLVKAPWISLVNLILNEALLTELIQQDMNPEKMQAELEAVLQTERQAILSEKYVLLRQVLGEKGAAEKAATFIRKLLEKVD